MVSAGNIVPLIVIVISIGLAVWTLTRSQPPRPGIAWLVTTQIVTALTAAALLIDPAARVGDVFGRAFVVLLVLGALLIAFGALLIRDVNQRSPGWWVGVGLVWLAALVIAGVAVPGTRVGERGWLSDLLAAPEPVGLIALAGLLAAGGVLAAVAYYGYYRSRLPEIANRALLWLLLAVAVLSGTALLVSGSDLLMIAGVLAVLLGVIGSTYAHLTHRAFDLRVHVLQILRTAIVIAMLTTLIFGAIAAADRLQLTRQMHAAALIVILALLLATLFLPLRQSIEAIFERMLHDKTLEATAAARKYSQRISGALDLKQLTKTITITLDEVLEVRRSGLIFAQKPDKADGSVGLRLPGGADDNGKETRGRLAKNSPILHRWSVERAPISQFDLDLDPAFRGVDEAEMAFFS